MNKRQAGNTMAVMKLSGPEYNALPKLVRDFASHKLVMDNCSEKTVCEYLYDLRTFFRFLIAEQNGLPHTPEAFEQIELCRIELPFLKEISESDIYAFLNFIASERDNGWSARSRKLTAIKDFFHFLTKTKHLFENDPTRDLTGPKRTQSLPKFLTYEESLSLLEAVASDKESKTVLRDYCIITLFLNCGMRLSELCGILLTDLRPGLEALIVKGKGRKERVIYLNDACKKAITAYIIERQEKNERNLSTTALFISSRGTQISPKTVQWMVYKYLDKAGLSGRELSVHKLRHTAATLMYQSGKVDVRVLKDILGHEQLNTTQIYTHVSDENMKRAIAENPLAEIEPVYPTLDEEDDSE